MSFDPGSRLDPSQIQDRRGGVSGRTVALGGGGLGIVGVILTLVLTLAGGGSGGSGGGGSATDILNQLSGLNGQQVGDPGSSGTVASECHTGADAQQKEDCRIVGYVNSIQSYWKDTLRGYAVVPTVFFSGQTDTGCGPASTDVGPFYCPADKNVYIDLGFFQELKTKFGAKGGTFAQGYVLAHEYGHHVQDLLGVLGGSGAQGAQGQRPDRAASRLLRRRMGRARRRDRLPEPGQPGQYRGCARCRRRRRRRPDPEEFQGSTNPETWTHG